MTLIAFLILVALAIASVGGAVLWGDRCRQQGWHAGFDDGYKSAVEFAREIEVRP